MYYVNLFDIFLLILMACPFGFFVWATFSTPNNLTRPQKFRVFAAMHGEAATKRYLILLVLMPVVLLFVLLIAGSLLGWM